MATTESNITGLRRKLGRLRSKLSQTREALNNIIPADADESLIITLELQENEFKLAINHAIEELAQAAKAEDGLFADQIKAALTPPPALFHSLDSMAFDTSPTVRRGQPQSFPLTPAAVPDLVQPQPARASDINKLDLPALRTQFELKGHMVRVERLLVENGAGAPDEGGRFIPFGSTRATVIAKLIISLRNVAGVHARADALSMYSDDWNEIKRQLLADYAREEILYDQLHRQMAALKWPKHGTDFPDFLNACREIWRHGRHVGSHPLVVQRDVIRHICKIVDGGVLRDTLKALDVTRAVDWEMCVEFDSDDRRSFLGALAEAARIDDLVHRAGNSSTPKDKVQRVMVGEPVSPQFAGEMARQEQANAVQHTAKPAYYKFTRDLYKRGLVVSFGWDVAQDTLSKLEDILASPPPTTVHQFGRDTRRRRGYLIGLSSDEEFASLSERCSALLKSSQADGTWAVRDYDNPPPPIRDRPNRVAHAPMEYHVNGTVTIRSPQGPEVLLDPSPILQVDCGAGLNYLTPSAGLRERIAEHTIAVTPFTVELADRATSVITRALRTTIGLFPADDYHELPTATGEILLHILNDANGHHQDTGGVILLGRDAISTFDLCITRCGVSANGVPLVETAARDKARLCEPVGLAQTAETAVSDTIGRIAERGWIPMVHSPHYEIRLRPLASGEPVDHPDQTHCFEVKLPEFTCDPSGKRSLSAIRAVEAQTRSMLNKMTFSKRATHLQLVEKYVNLGWWIEESPEECHRQSRFAPVPAFMVGGGFQSTRKPRIVVNFKPVNVDLPPSSTPSTIPAHLIAALRCQRPECVVVSDAAAAFYKLRLANDKVWLTAAVECNGQILTRHFLSDRVVFGLLCGPASLVTSMEALFYSDQCPAALKAFNGWFMDDDILAGAVKDVADSLRYSVVLLRRVGHELQLEKCAAICRPPLTADLASALQGVGDICIAESLCVFGCTMKFTEDTLAISCSGTSSRGSALRLLAVPLPDVINLRMTKAQYFAIAGSLGYDLMKDHCRHKTLADALRSLIGREFAPIGWRKPLDLHGLSPAKLEAMQIICHWAADLANEPACVHRTQLPTTQGERIELSVHVDASSAGGGFTVRSGTDQLWADSWRWTGAETRWHINFQELKSLYWALRAVADILRCLTKCSPVSRVKPLVRIHSDNRSAVKWTHVSHTDFISKHQSRHSLQRLVDQIAEEWSAVKGMSDSTIEHLAGALNGRADELSRLYIRSLPDADRSLHELLECEPRTRKPAASRADRHVLSAIESGAFEPTKNEADCPPAANDLVGSEFDPEYKLHERGTSRLPFDDHECSDQVQAIAEDCCEHVPSELIPTGTACLIAVDRVCALRSTQADPPVENEPLVEAIARLSYDTKNVNYYFNLLRVALRAWKRKEAVRPDDPAAAEPLPITIARSAQSTMDREKLATALRDDTGPLFWNSESAICYYRSPRPDGTYESLPFIPASVPWTQKLLLREAHRRCDHLGLDYTLARTSSLGVVLHKARAAAAEVCRGCLFCQSKRATRGFKAAFTMAHNREGHYPYESIAVDHYFLGDKIKCLSILCLSTGHLSLSHCASLTAADSMTALRRILHRFGVSPRFILADKAANLAATADLLGQEFGPCEFSQTCANSQFENGRLERMHGVVRDILSAKAHFAKLEILATSPPLQIQDLLDQVSHTVNLRPLGTFVSDPDASEEVIPLSPHVIVYGNAGELTTVRTPQLNVWKKLFYDVHWKKLKKNSELALRPRPHQFYVGEPVLVYSPGNSAKICRSKTSSTRSLTR